MSAVVTPLKPVGQPAAAPSIAAAPSGRSVFARFRSGLGFAVREPFFQFLFLGLLIWLAAEFVEAQNQRYTIHVGPAERQRLAIAYQQQFNQAPTPEQLQSLTENYIKQQIFVREGKALGLDTNDEIVDRRIAQKFEFIQQDLGVPDDPSPGAVRNWYERHKLSYLTPVRFAFTQIYFSPDSDGDAAARDRALGVLKTLRGGSLTRAPSLGDRFPGPSDLGALSSDEAARLFGESDFTTQLFKLPPGRWSGPFRSGYGWHLVYVAHVLPPTLPTFDEVRDRVASDYRDEERHILNAQAYENLRAKYKIQYEGDR
jgi:peptidyl-prolyl cis-trans isomerase C